MSYLVFIFVVRGTAAGVGDSEFGDLVAASASWTSFCIVVTLFKWMAHELVSENKCTMNASAASSWRVCMAWLCQRRESPSTGHSSRKPALPFSELRLKDSAVWFKSSQRCTEKAANDLCTERHFFFYLGVESFNQKAGKVACCALMAFSEAIRTNVLIKEYCCLISHAKSSWNLLDDPQ